MEYRDGAEAALGWQCAESGWPKSASDEHEWWSSPEQGCPGKWLMFAMCDIELYTLKWVWQSSAQMK